VSGQRHAPRLIPEKEARHPLDGTHKNGQERCGKSRPHRDSILELSIPQRVAIPTALCRPVRKKIFLLPYHQEGWITQLQIPYLLHQGPQICLRFKAFFIFHNDAHNYKITGILKQLKFRRPLRHVSVHAGTITREPFLCLAKTTVMVLYPRILAQQVGMLP
jgi:hypothetical protein